eukprot:827746-Rhodomonas_salina.3
MRERERKRASEQLEQSSTRRSHAPLTSLAPDLCRCYNELQLPQRLALPRLTHVRTSIALSTRACSPMSTNYLASPDLDLGVAASDVALQPLRCCLHLLADRLCIPAMRSDQRHEPRRRVCESWRVGRVSLLERFEGGGGGFARFSEPTLLRAVTHAEAVSQKLATHKYGWWRMALQGSWLAVEWCGEVRGRSVGARACRGVSSWAQTRQQTATVRGSMSGEEDVQRPAEQILRGTDDGVPFVQHAPRTCDPTHQRVQRGALVPLNRTSPR